MNSQQVQDMRLMYEAVYNDELWELANEYNNTIYDEDIVEVATEYFYTYGLNEDGIDILIEKVGLDNFVEFVYDLSEDLTILAEERSAKKRTGGESYADVKAKIDAKEAAKKKAKEEALKRKESERMEPASNDADTESKKEQPKSKKPIRDAIARQILAGMKRHREATQTAGRLAGETGKTLGKIASFAGEAGRRAGEHVKKHGMKSLANSYEYDTFDAILEHLIAEGYADTNESALAIMANMSEEWRESIVEDAAYNTLTGFGYPGAIVAVGLNKLSGGKIAKPDQPKPKSTPTPKAPTVSSPGGKTGTVTVDKQYPATLNKEKGMKSTGPTGTEYFSPFVPGTTVTDPGKSRFKATSQEYERIPAEERPEYQVTPRVSDATKYDPAYKPISMRRPGNYRT